MTERIHWAADVAAKTLTGETEQRTVAAAALERDVQLRARAAAGAEGWFDRVTTELEALAAAFNARVRCRRLVVLRTAATVTLRAHDFGYVLFASVVDDACVPGIDVTTEAGGRRTRQPYDFAVREEQLEINGEAPAAFCRRAVERWLGEVPVRELGGGLPPAA